MKALKALFLSVVVFCTVRSSAEDGSKWVPPNDRVGFIDLFMPTFDVPDEIFGINQKRAFVYVGSIFESYRYGTGEHLVGQDTYAQVWAIRKNKWALLLPRFDFFYPGASFAPPVKEGVIIGFSLRTTFK